MPEQTFPPRFVSSPFPAQHMLNDVDPRFDSIFTDIYVGPSPSIRLFVPFISIPRFSASARLPWSPSRSSSSSLSHGDVSSPSDISDVPDQPHIHSSSRHLFMTGHATWGLKRNFFLEERRLDSPRYHLVSITFFLYGRMHFFVHPEATFFGFSPRSAFV